MNIKVDLNTNIADGYEVVFRSPADCSQVTGLVIYHNGGKTEFAFADAHGNNVGDIDHLFAENAVVKVILDVTSGMAFVQNADTNAYIERTFVKSVNGQAPDKNGNVETKIPEGGNGTPGNDGKDGGYYVPTVEQVNEAEVEISFASKGGENMPQVEPVKLILPRGADGKKGDQGEQGPKGDTGATGPQGEPGAKGEQGIPGEKGEKGDPGIPGNDGAPGADGGDGYTPVKGVDYYTSADKAEFEAFIATELAKMGQLKPEFANSAEECTDTTKLYVLPDGFYYAYMAGLSSRRFTAADFVYSEVNSDGSLTGAGYTRIPTAELVDLSAGAVSISCPEPYQYFVYYYSGNDESTFIGKTSWKSGNIDDVLKDTIASGTISGAKYCRISLRDGTNTSGLLRDRMDEFMANIIVSQMSDTPVYGWRSTGHAFNQPADYEDRLIALERALEGVEYGSY